MPSVDSAIQRRTHRGARKGPVAPTEAGRGSPPALQCGLAGDWGLVPDLDVFARCVGEAFGEPRAAAP